MCIICSRSDLTSCAKVYSMFRGDLDYTKVALAIYDYLTKFFGGLQ